MRRLRLLADVLAVTEVEDGADNRAARCTFAGQKGGGAGAEHFPIIASAFAGPETVDGVDNAILERIGGA